MVTLPATESNSVRITKTNGEVVNVTEGVVEIFPSGYYIITENAEVKDFIKREDVALVEKVQTCKLITTDQFLAWCAENGI